MLLFSVTLSCKDRRTKLVTTEKIPEQNHLNVMHFELVRQDKLEEGKKHYGTEYGKQ